MASGETNTNRPYSLSKDEALARMLQEEEYSAVNHEDEQLARSLQRNMMFDSDEDSSRPGEGNMRTPLRTMTPITQLFTTLVNAGLHNNSRQSRQRLGLLQLSSDEEANNDSDNSDSTVDGEEEEPNTLRSNPSVTSNSSTSSVRGRAGSRVATRATGRGRMGIRPTEFSVHVSPGNAASEPPRSMFSTSTDLPSSRSNTSVRGNRLTRGAATRGTRRGTTRRTTNTSGANAGTGESCPEGQSTSQISSRPQAARRIAPPRFMEPSIPPLSLAVNQPELPDGEMEPEILILDRGTVGNDARFLHIMRDPMLLLLFLMGRTPHLLVPDDIDPTDYEALWDLAERLGEVKSRGLSEEDLKSLSTKKYCGKSKVNKEGQTQSYLNYVFEVG